MKEVFASCCYVSKNRAAGTSHFTADGFLFEASQLSWAAVIVLLVVVGNIQVLTLQLCIADVVCRHVEVESLTVGV